jgi:SAM-dependent methyltransferase
VCSILCLISEQHNTEIQENRKLWARKPLLQKLYSQFYREISQRIKQDISGRTVELGSGIGSIKKHIPHCITTDIFQNPWLDQVENAYRLSFKNGEVSNLILFDVWHHLRYPGTALKEFSRVLSPGGRVVIFDPAMGLVGRLVFGHFHHEPLGMSDVIEWDAPSGFSGERDYYAAQANASRVFGSRAFASQLKDWRVVEVKYFSGLAYVASGGFRGPQLYPQALLPCMNLVDGVFSNHRILASRMLVVLEPRISQA